MRLSKYYCAWCEGARLEFRDVRYDAPNGSSSVSNQGIVLSCSLAQVTNCPNATGTCRTEVEAENYASELCKTHATYETAESNIYTDQFITWRRATRPQQKESFRLATKYRDEMLSDLNIEGAGYTETHGE